ncbi:MAG: exodeoxyribonuclease VII small subunit [Alistipes sp.]|nr:exodeoxyribonuclease VII small subunit [Alistipes sp.]
MAENKMTYAEAMAEVERILEKFRSEELSVDDLAADVKRATELVALCRKRLRKAEEDVRKALGEDD